jgi:colanic acid/amylovoran biosynthesis glycosyltransferase
VPTVASYCTTFLKPEMLHIYRQVTGLQRYRTFIVAKERTSADRFPFSDIEMVPRKPRKNFIRRFWLKHVRKLPALYYRGEMQGLMKIFRRRNADLMHIYFGHTGVHLLPFVKGWGKPCVVSFHGADVMPREHQPEYDGQLRELLRVTPLVLARSLSLAERLKELGCPPEKIRLNRTGIPLGEYPLRERRTPEDGAWHFVQACRLIPKKGIATALKAFAGFHREYPRARFSLAGEGPMKREVEEMALELGIAKAVELRAFLGQADLARLYGEAHFFVHPSEMTADQNQEGVPNSMLEAMATGLPVLATLHGGIPEAVESGRTGLLVPERDEVGLLRAMLDLAAHPERAFAMGRAASESVRLEFEQRKQIEKLESYYDEAREIGAAAMKDQTPVAVAASGKMEHASHSSHASHHASFAYLFERFPSFTQTFCFREVEEMLRQGMEPAIYSIREAEEGSAFDSSLIARVRYLPRDEALNKAVREARAAHRIHSDVWEVFAGWGDRGDKTRLYEAAWLGLELKRRGIRHVHAQFAGIAARTAYWIKQFYGIGYSFTGHANDMFCETDLPVSLDELVKEARLVVTVTDFSRDWLRRRCPRWAGKIERVYNGIHPGEFATGNAAFDRSKPVGPAPPEIVSVGRLIEKKGFGDLIAACGMLRDRGVEYLCRIIGAGPLEEALRGQIEQSGLAGRVLLEGARPEAEVIGFLRRARVFALACARDSEGGSDNLPTVIMEAMAAGLPVISTRVAGVPEMIDDRVTGRLLGEHDVPGLADALELLLKDAALARRWGSAGRVAVEKKFATQRTTSDLKHLLARRAAVWPPVRAARMDPSLLRDALMRLARIP